jgi:hypothetical protein
MSDWVDIQIRARRDIHAAFGVEASYLDSTMSVPATGLHVRWHARFAIPTGDIGGGDYAQVFENIDKLVFDIDELSTNAVTLRQGGQVTLIKYGYTFTLDVQEPYDGPVKVTWTVATR